MSLPCSEEKNKHYLTDMIFGLFNFQFVRYRNTKIHDYELYLSSKSIVFMVNLFCALKIRNIVIVVIFLYNAILFN